MSCRPHNMLSSFCFWYVIEKIPSLRTFPLMALSSHVPCTHPHVWPFSKSLHSSTPQDPATYSRGANIPYPERPPAPFIPAAVSPKRSMTRSFVGTASPPPPQDSDSEYYIYATKKSLRRRAQETEYLLASVPVAKVDACRSPAGAGSKLGRPPE